MTDITNDTANLNPSSDEAEAHAEAQIFKFRAEFPADIWQAIIRFAWVDIVEIRIENDSIVNPVCSITLGGDYTLDHVRNELAKIEDGHVMAETVALEPDYTGKRNYGMGATS